MRSYQNLKTVFINLQLLILLVASSSGCQQDKAAIKTGRSEMKEKKQQHIAGSKAHAPKYPLVKGAACCKGVPSRAIALSAR